MPEGLCFLRLLGPVTIPSCVPEVSYLAGFKKQGFVCLLIPQFLSLAMNLISSAALDTVHLGSVVVSGALKRLAPLCSSARVSSDCRPCSIS